MHVVDIYNSISASKRSPPLFVLLPFLNRVTIARLLLLLLLVNTTPVFPMSLCVVFF